MKARHVPLGLFLASLFCAIGAAHGTLLVYEGFDYALADDANMNGVATNATGLKGNYANNTTGGGNVPFRYDTTGLTFSSNFFATEGGSVSLTLSSSQFGILGASLDTGTVTGTLYQSYLVNFATLPPTGTGSGTFTRISNEHAATNSVRLALAPEATLSGRAVGAGYDGTADTVMSAGTGALSTGTTYLFVGRFTNVGTALSGATPGTVNLWVFTPAAYDSWFGAGANEADLNTYATFTATDTVTTGGPYTFSSSAYLQLAATTFVSAGTSGNITVNYDEMRFGTQLANVVNTVPEPAGLGLAAAGFAIVLTRRRRNG